jgi:multiple sugar transport system ATP-binding protein
MTAPFVPAGATMADVAFHAISKRFGPVVAVQDLSLSIKDGEFFVLLGPTGVGKTTTLRLAAGLETPDTGRIEIAGHDMTNAPPAARDVAFVFQQYSLYPHLSVYDNLAFPLRSPLRPMIETEIRKRVTEIARLLRIDDKLQNSATRLSGGQMQRVAIGRALVRKPAIYLMDEPLSSLDAKLRSELRLELKRIQKDLGATILYVTHDQIEAMTMADHIGVLDSGRLVQVGSPREIYEDPASTYVATRLGSPAINLLPRALFPDVPASAPTTTFGARTENIRLKRANGHAQGKIRWIEHLGDQNHLHIEMGGQNLVTLVDPDAPLEIGTEVAIELARPLWFDADGNRVRA